MKRSKFAALILSTSLCLNPTAFTVFAQEDSSYAETGNFTPSVTYEDVPTIEVDQTQMEDTTILNSIQNGEYTIQVIPVTVLEDEEAKKNVSPDIITALENAKNDVENGVLKDLIGDYTVTDIFDISIVGNNAIVGSNGWVTLTMSAPAEGEYILVHNIETGVWEKVAYENIGNGLIQFTVNSLSPFAVAVPAETPETPTTPETPETPATPETPTTPGADKPSETPAKPNTEKPSENGNTSGTVNKPVQNETSDNKESDDDKSDDKNSSSSDDKGTGNTGTGNTGGNNGSGTGSAAQKPASSSSNSVSTAANNNVMLWSILSASGVLVLAAIRKIRQSFEK